MASAIGKRKRDLNHTATKSVKKVAVQAPALNSTKQPELSKGQAQPNKTGFKAALSSTSGTTSQRQPDGQVHIQIVTGSYERVLHGICAIIPSATLDPTSDDSASKNAHSTSFSDTFLFAAHASSIRCMAISPPTDQHSDKRYLATGSSDERINVYSLSTVPPQVNATPTLPSLNPTATAENPHNRSLGSLNHHDRAVTCLYFPMRTKLVSAAEDATIAISRTRDWTVLSSIKAPIPKPYGRPSGDTAGPGEVPAGVNDFAIHPSQRLMLSVGRGERCLRLWNLMTGKKAGVLNFDRDLLSQLGEGRFGTGEGRRVLWDGSGENYVVGFERAAAVFGIDSKPKAVIRPSPPSKLHQMRLLPLQPAGNTSILAVSTEDGRILFFDTEDIEASIEGGELPSLVCLGQLGGPSAGITGRLKDFDILRVSHMRDPPGSSLLIVTGSSDGAVRLWTLSEEQITRQAEATVRQSEIASASPGTTTPQIGRLVGMLETGDRITCLGAFLLNGIPNDRISEEVSPAPLHEGGPSEEGEESDEE